MSKGNDVFSNTKRVTAVTWHDFVSDVEGILIEVAGYSGIVKGVLEILEDGSEAATEILTVTVHKVDADSETLNAANQIATFVAVAGSNTTSAQYNQEIAINLDLVDTKYIQFNLVETNTYEAWVGAHVEFGGASNVPTQ